MDKNYLVLCLSETCTLVVDKFANRSGVQGQAFYSSIHVLVSLVAVKANLYMY